MPFQRVRPWRERPPLSGCLDRHRGGLACARPCHPPPGVAPLQQSLAGRPSSAAASAAYQRIRPPVAAFHQLGGSASRPSEVGVGARPSPNTAPRWLRLPPVRATCRPRARHGLPERGRPGDRRGRSHPRQPLPGTREAWPQRVGWLPTSNGREPALRTPPKTPLRAPPGTAGTGPSRSTSPGLLAGSLTDGEAESDHVTLGDGGAPFVRSRSALPHHTPRGPAIVDPGRFCGP